MNPSTQQLLTDYPGLEDTILTVVRTHWSDLSDLLPRAAPIRALQASDTEQTLHLTRIEAKLENVDENLRLYREDFHLLLEQNEKFRQDVKEEKAKFRQEIKEENAKFRQEVNQRFEKIDQRFEKIDQRFEKIDQRFENLQGEMRQIYQSINRMTVFFISGIAIIGTILTLVDKLWK